MNSFKELTLPSGAILKIAVAPFSDAKALYQAVLEELRGVVVSDKDEIGVNMLKDLFCAGFSSKKIESSLGKCLGRCLYNGEKITPETWEPVETRQDYMKTLVEVARENIAPFVSGLSAEFSLAKSILRPDPALRPKTAI